jgi:hypothetical protein
VKVRLVGEAIDGGVDRLWGEVQLEGPFSALTDAEGISHVPGERLDE